MAEEKKGLVAGFKEFVMRGNAMEMAVGIVIGGAFTAVVTAIVEGIINPIIAGLVGKPNFDTVLAFPLGDATVTPGLLITALVNFLLIALAVYFIIVLPMNKLRERTAKEEEIEETGPTSEDLLTEIRDLLAKQNA